MKALARLRDPYTLMLVVVALMGPVFVGLSFVMLGGLP